MKISSWHVQIILHFSLPFRLVAVLRPLHHSDPQLADQDGLRGWNEHRGRREADGVHRPAEPDGQDLLRASRRLQAQVFALDITTRSESYKQAACRFLWCPNKTSIGFIQEIFLFKLFFLQVGLKMGWSYFRQLTGGRLTSNLKKV